jgi:hypothetical protein
MKLHASLGCDAIVSSSITPAFAFASLSGDRAAPHGTDHNFWFWIHQSSSRPQFDFCRILNILEQIWFTHLL